MSSITYTRWGALGELIQWHLCPAMDRVLVQLYIIRPPTSCIICSSGLSWSDSDTAVTQLTLLVQAFIDPPCPPTPFRMQFQVLKQRTGFFAACPINLSSSSPHPISIWLCWIYGGSFLTPVCLYIRVPLFQSQGAVYQHTEGRWKMGAAIPSCSSRGPHALCLPTALSGCTWPFMSPTYCHPSPNLDPKQWMQEGASSQHVLSQDPCTCYVFFQDFPPDSLRAPMSPYLRQQRPLAFPWEHTSQPNSAFFLY